MKTSASTHCLKNSISSRSIKYEIDNSHVLSVVAADLQTDLMAIREKADKISEVLKHSLKEDSLGDDEMVEIYALRRKVKEKLKEMEEMEHFVESLKKKERMEEVGLSMSIIY
jgi:predicted RNase H-like nuclease (RuvC/YqgF family)